MRLRGNLGVFFISPKSSDIHRVRADLERARDPISCRGEAGFPEYLSPPSFRSRSCEEGAVFAARTTTLCRACGWQRSEPLSKASCISSTDVDLSASEMSLWTGALHAPLQAELLRSPSAGRESSQGLIVQKELRHGCAPRQQASSLARRHFGGETAMSELAALSEGRLHPKAKHTFFLAKLPPWLQSCHLPLCHLPPDDLNQLQS